MAGLERLRFPVLVLLVVGGLAARLPGLGAPPVEYQAVRQYRSALLARALWVRLGAPVENWRREVAEAARPPLLEPPVLEAAAALGYRALGGELLWLPRGLSVAAWFAAALALYAVARALVSPDAAVATLAVMVAAPGAVSVSRSFQPEALQAAFAALALVAMLDAWSRPSSSRTLRAAAAAFGAVFLKATALFVVLPACLVLPVGPPGRGAVRRRLPVLAGALLPLVLWYGPGMVGGGALAGQAAVSFRPSLALEGETWRGAVSQAAGFLGLPVLVVGLAGLLLSMVRGLRPALPGALAAGWAALVVAQPHHAATHDYYALGLLMAAALGCGIVADEVSSRLALRLGPGRASAVVMTLVVVVSGAGLAGAVADRQARIPPLDGWLAMASRVGEAVGHSTEVCVLGRAYGYPLRYHAWVAGPVWPPMAELAAARRRGEAPVEAEERLAAFRPEPRYFVVTDGDELARQPDLERLLLGGFRVALSEPGRVVVLDLKGRMP